jgi:hypothetical protein
MVLSPGTPTRREVDAIIEADESLARSRTQSLVPQFLSEEPQIPAVPVPVAVISTGRSRSHTESSTSRPSIGRKPSTGSALLRKASFNGASRDRSSPDNIPPTDSPRTRTISEAPKLATMAAPPPRKRGVARRRESMDLDDIINEPVGPRRGAPGSTLMPKPAHQTANTRDLIDFLSEGPPEPSPQVSRSASLATIEPGATVKPKQSGRWFRRLVGGSTSERAPSISVPDVPEPTIVRVLGKQKSVQSIRGNSAAGYASASGYGKVPPSPSLSVDTVLQPYASVNLTRKVSPNRKAVPTWNPDEESVARSPEPSQGPGPSPASLSPRRDVFVPTKPSPQEPAPISPPLRNPSLRRVPVPKVHADGSASRVEVSEHGLQIATGSVSSPKSPEPLFSSKPPEPRPERRRPEKISEPHIVTIRSVERKPTELPPPASPVAPANHITSGQAAELRAAIAHATTADECRMLLDLVLGQWGQGRHDPEPSAVPPLSAGCSDFDDTDEALAVDMLLGEGTMRSESRWPLTPKDSHPRLHEAGISFALRSSE